MIWKRDQYIAHCHHQFTGREMFCELFGPLHILEQEWRQQGATEKELNLTAFDWDYVLKINVGGVSAVTGIEPVILEDTPEYRILINDRGQKCKLCKEAATIPLPLDFPVKTMDDWLKIKHWYTFQEGRVDREALLQKKKMRDNEGYLTLFGFPGGYDETRSLMGEINLSIAYYEQPELIEDILATIMDNTLKTMERVCDVVPIDNLIIHEDMAGKNGPLIGPKQVKQFLAPYYKTVWEAAKSCGASLFSQDSDGNMEADMDAFIDCGLQCFYPCEPAAGMDMVKLRKKYGDKIYFKGGIDKMALRHGKEAIRRELEYKMSAPMLGGGTIFALDHRIPNGVPLEDYRYYVETGREILGLPPISGEGWQRMAF